MHKLETVKLTSVDKLSTSVEHRTRFALDQCEFNVFETHEQAEKVKLKFEGFTITSMLRGKKVLHNQEGSLDYVPGQTFMLNAYEDMVIDFPDAKWTAPTQCTALVLDSGYLQRHIDYLNEHAVRDKELDKMWSIDNGYFLKNDETIAAIGNKLVKLFSGNDPLKEVLIDLKLKELLLAIMRQQNMQALQHPTIAKHVNERLLAVVEYIRKNATEEFNIQQLSKMAYMSKSSFYRMFSNEFGISPNKMILIEKINLAKAMISSGAMAMKEVCFASGFSDPNYFSRVFKKLEGLTPMEYRALVAQKG